MDARKQRYGADDLPALMSGAERILVAKGKRAVELRPERDGWEAVAAAALGPSGNLRAPAVRVGTTWLVGFQEEAWAGALG